MTEVSIIIPVLHEEKYICNCIQDISQKAENINYEIIIVDGDENGSTIKEIPSGWNHIRTITSSPGRARQMNEGAKLASGKVLLFLHADTILPPFAFEKISSLFVHDPYVAGAFDLKIDSSRWFLKLISRVSSLRSRLTRIPYGDQAIFILRDYFHEIGGYAEIPIMEDVALMRYIKNRKDKIHIFKEKVMISSRRWEKEGILYTTLRNWALLSLYIFGVSPLRLSSFYPCTRLQEK